MIFASGKKHDAVSADGKSGSQYLLWIDSVGTFLVCLGDRISIGGPTLEGQQADIALFASLSRKHATVVRGPDAYLLESHAPTKVAGRDVHDVAFLNDDYLIELGEKVKLRFRLPTALSASANLEFLSEHRPSHSVDSVVLMHDTCLLGPGAENHIQCPEWPGTVLMLHRQGRLWCKSRLDVCVGDKHAKDETPFNSGDIVTGSDLRFRLEALSGIGP